MAHIFLILTSIYTGGTVGGGHWLGNETPAAVRKCVIIQASSRNRALGTRNTGGMHIDCATDKDCGGAMLGVLIGAGTESSEHEQQASLPRSEALAW